MAEKLLNASGVRVFKNWFLREAGTSGAADIPNEAVLLWENANPTSNFDRQDIPVDLSDYDGAMITYAMYKSVPCPIYSRAIKIWGTDALQGAALKEGGTGGRYCVVLPDHVSFMDGWHSGSVDNGYAIPIAIYGVRMAYRLIAPTVAGRRYFVKPRDPEGSELSGFSASKQVNGNDVFYCGWGAIDTGGVGFSMMTQRQTNSYALMVSNEAVSLSPHEILVINVSMKCYNGNDCFFLIAKNDLPDDLKTTAYSVSQLKALASGSGDSFLDLVSSNNTFTKKMFTVETYQQSPDYYLLRIYDKTVHGNTILQSTDVRANQQFYLAFIVAGSGSDNYHGQICIEEAYII